MKWAAGQEMEQIQTTEAAGWLTALLLTEAPGLKGLSGSLGLVASEYF